MVKEVHTLIREYYFSTLRKATPRAPLVNTTLVVEENMFENHMIGKQISGPIKDGLKNLSG